MAKVLIADDERSICDALALVLSRAGHCPLIASDGAEALALVRKERPAVVVVDVRMPGLDGLATLRRIKAESPETPIIVMTAYGTVETAVSAVREGAFEYLGKPIDLAVFRDLIARAVGHTSRSSAGSTAVPPGPIEPFELIGQSAEMQEVFKLMGLVMDTDLTVLVTGESGVGKELVARGIHRHSHRRDRPFVAINCAAIPRELLESELFGHERGAFSGAVTLRVGRFEAAGNGTLFLDEIGELPNELQGKLLRVFQERQFERLGSNAPLPLQARLVLATNRDLAAEVAAGQFREDLYHRVNLVHLHVPPLRDRRNDIAILAHHFLSQASHEFGKTIRGIDAEALERLRARDWPGNVRELENVLRKSVLLTQSDWLTTADLALPDPRAGKDHAGQCQLVGSGDLAELRTATTHALQACVAQSATRETAPFQMIVSCVEETLIGEALRLTDSNQVAASRLLGVSRTTLRKKMPGC